MTAACECGCGRLFDKITGWDGYHSVGTNQRPAVTGPDPLAEVLGRTVEAQMRARTYDRHAQDEDVFMEGVEDIAAHVARAAREHIAAEIEAERDSEPAVTREDMAYNTGMFPNWREAVRVLGLISIGVLIGWGAVGLAAHLIFGRCW